MLGFVRFAALILPTRCNSLLYGCAVGLGRLRSHRSFSLHCMALLSILALSCASTAMHAATVTLPGTTAVGSSTTGTSVTMTASGGTVGSVLVLTGGIANQDFTLNSAGSCTMGAVLNSGSTCTLAVDFTPRYPGQRFGAVILLDSNGLEMGSTDLLATGKGPLALFDPGQIQTVAGDDFWFYLGDNVAATSASIYLPYGIAVDGAQNLYIADSGNNRIRRVDGASGIITTVVGTGSPGFFGDNGPAVAAKITEPRSVAVDGRGDLYIVDTGNHVVRRVDAVTHAIVTVAGVGGTQGYSGDNGPATMALLNTPTGIALDGLGHLYVADSGNNVIRVVDLSSGKITAFAGSGLHGFAGDGGLATAAQLNGPSGVTAAPNGDVYIADLFNNCVRMVHAGQISSVAGDGTSGSAFSGDGGLAASAKLKAPASISFDPAGNLYISDSGNNRVRKINVVTGVIQTVVGSDAESFTGDGGDATSAGLDGPYAMVVDGEGNLLVTDVFHNRVRRVSSVNQQLMYSDIRVNRVSPPQTRTIENDGNDVLTFSAFNAVQNATVDLPTTSCSTSSPLGISLTCNVGADFAPTVVGNQVVGTINLLSNSPNAPQVLTLSGNVLTLDPSTVVLSSSQNPSALNASVTFTASVSGVSPTPTGTVTFYDGGLPLGSSSIVGSGVATLSTTTLTLGNHNITATFAGDVNHAPSTSEVLVQQIKNGTLVTLSVDNATVTFGSAVTLTVVATGSTTQPTGTVQFLDGVGNLVSGTLVPVGGTKTSSLSVSVTTLAVGVHTLTAAYLGDPANLGNVSNAVSETITKVGTGVLLSTSNNDVVYSASFTLTALVTNATGGVPTGTVTFKDVSGSGATLGTASVDGSGSASLPVSTLPVGTHSIVATYSGDSNNIGSSSGAVAQTVEPISTTTTLSSGSASANGGKPVVFTAIVTPALNPTSPPLSGSVVFRDSGVVLGTGTLIGNSATFTTSTLGVGGHNVTATYTGVTDYGGSVSTPYTQQIVLATTSATLTAAPLPAVAGKNVMLTGTLTSTGVLPTGQVTFKDGTTYIGTGTLDASGVATLSLNTLGAGPHLLSVIYGGDAHNSSVTATLALSISQATTTTVLSSSGTPSVVGLPVTLRAAASGNGATPTGIVTFFQNTTALGTGTVDGSGNASLVVNLPTVGSYTLSAVYAGDTNDLPSTSPAFTQQVQKTTTNTTLTSSSLTAQQGAAVQFAAQVSSNAATPGGTVLFYDGTTLIGSATLNAAGLAVLNVTNLIPGQHNITAVFPGDSANGSSTSAGLPQVIQPITAVGLSADKNPASAGATITFTAGVSGAGVVPTGVVTFFDGAAVLGSAHLNAAGVGTITVSTLTSGVHAIKASFPGDANNSAGASQVLNETINQATTQTLLTLPGSTAPVNAALTLIASVSGTGAIPGGTVTFYDGTTALSIVTLSPTGTASLTTSSLAIGTHPLQAVYSGDTNDGASSSNTQTLSVQKGTGTLQIAASVNPALGGQPVTFTSVLQANQGTPTGTVNWYDGTVLLSTTPVSNTETSTLTVSTLTAGGHTISAVYSGDANFNSSTSNPLNEVVNLGTSQTALTASNMSSVAGQPLTFSVAVTGTGAQPGGSVVLKSDGAVLGTIPLDASGNGSFTTSALSASAHTVTATYAGDANHTGSFCQPLAITVTQAVSKTLLSSGANPSVILAPVTLYATVTGTGVPPGGTVTFSDGANTLGIAVLDAAGQASLTVNSLFVGTHALTAAYGGDSTHGSSVSLALQQVVIQAPTTTSLVSSRNPAAVGDAINFTVNVTGVANPSAGTVALRDGGTVVASGSLSAAGSLTFSVSTLSSGSHTLTAVYAGDANNIASTSTPLAQLVQQSATTTTLIASATNVFLHDPVTLSVAVSGLGGATGLTATILDGTTAIATVPLNTNGLGSFVTTSLGLNGHSLSATFSGTAKFIGSSSAPTVVTVEQAGTAVTLASSRNPAIVGDSIFFTVSVTGTGSQPTGTVVVTDGMTALQTLSLSGGTASFSTSGLVAGTHALLATYGGDTTHNAANSVTLAQVVSQASSSATLTADKPQALTGDNVTFTIAVTSGYGQPGGTATLYDGAAPLTTVQLDATGHATFITGALLAGPHSLVAQYAGDGAHLPAQSAAFTETVQQVTGLTLTSSSPLATVGDTLTFSVVLTGVDTQINPVVTLLDGAILVGRVALDSTGHGTLATSALAPGTHTLSASFAGDTTHEAALSANLLQVVQPANSMVTLDSNKNPASTSDSINLTIAVAGAGGSPGGVVTILEGSTPLGTAFLGSNGIGSFTTSTLSAGLHNLTAQYGGDSNHAAATSPVLAQIVLQPTSTNVVSNNNPAVGGGSITFTATVAGTNGASSTPLTGTVTFNDGVVALATVPVSTAGSASFTTSTLAPGDHSITATYSGDSQNGSSVSAAIVESVQTVSTLTSLAASADHLIYATGVGSTTGATSPLTLTATVASNGTALSGTVQFLDGSSLLGTAAVGVGGVATLTVNTLTPGVHILLAIYKGDSNHLTSTSNPLSLPVLQGTAVSLSASSNPVYAQAAFTLLIGVSNGTTSVPPTGAITVRDGSSVLGTAVLSAGGTASVPVVGLAAGLHTLVATYDGDGRDTGSLSQPLPVQVNLYPDTNTLIVSASTLLHGQSITLKTTVNGNAAVEPSGTVVFLSGGKTLGTAALNASGIATLTLTPDDGTYNITSVYAGDSLYTGSTSAAGSLTVSEAPTFTIALDPNTMSLASKQHVTLHVILTSANRFTDNLSLGCVGLPQAATCTFSTDHQALAANGTQTLNLTIDTGSPLIAGGAASGQARNEMHATQLKLCMLPLGAVLSLLVYRRRQIRWAGSLLAFVLLLLFSSGLTGCGALDVNGTPAGAYSFSVTAIGANTGATQSAPMALTVTR